MAMKLGRWVVEGFATLLHIVLLLPLLLLLQSWLNLDAHTGTHIDAPAHFLKGGSTVEDLDLDILIGERR
jgi:hypothetical protein